jgi:hypothetical protein
VSDDKLILSAVYLIKKSLDLKNLNQLIGIPLQTKMIADIYLNKLNFGDIKINNIAELYCEFVETKFKIKLNEKKAIESNRRSFTEGRLVESTIRA